MISVRAAFTPTIVPPLRKMSEPGISRWAILAGVVGAAFLFRHYSRSGSASGTGTGNAKSTSVSAKPAPPPSIKRTVKSLSIFPVKSCKGIDVDEARCEDIGFALDRYWVVVCPETAGEDGKEPEHPVKINTLRESPSMALIGTALEFDDKKLKAGTGLYKDGGTLVLSAPGMEDCRVRFPRKAKEGEKPWTCFMFFNVNQLLDEGDEVASWLSKYLGKECRLAVQVRSKWESPARRSCGQINSLAALPLKRTGHNLCSPDTGPLDSRRRFLPNLPDAPGRLHTSNLQLGRLPLPRHLHSLSRRRQILHRRRYQSQTRRTRENGPAPTGIGDRCQRAFW